MTPEGSDEVTIGETVCTCVYNWKKYFKYFKNLLKNHWTKRVLTQFKREFVKIIAPWGQ
jgi:hypothetical protein